MSALLISSWLSHPAIARTAEPGHDSASAVLRIQPNDALTRSNLKLLTSQAPTGRELVDRIERLQDVVLILRAHPLLMRQAQLLGRGNFWVVKGHLFGLLEYQAQPLGSRQAIRIIAHELGHALEVSLLPRGVDTATMRDLVLAQETPGGRQVSGIETEFARAVGYRVQLELLHRLRGPSSLAALADSMHLVLDAPQSRSGSESPHEQNPR